MCIVMNAFPVSVTCYTLTFRCFLPSFLSLPISPTFPVECFCSQFTGSKVLLDSSLFLPRFPSFLLHCIRDALVCLFIFSSLSLSLFYLLTSVRSISVFFFLPSLSFPVFLSPSSPFFRAHNCIIERLFSQLTPFPLSVPILSHF